ncbi:hypothetical protein PT109_01515 [Erysipelothrix rhusiopathiae]|nr:hypothetical protein [Erysipelothrix rhusiopathiae]MDE8180966.1 hypothetical protein [Erysipelothrix rhusiopathiae]
MKLAFDKVILPKTPFKYENEMIYTLDIWLMFDYEFNDNDFSESILNRGGDVVPIYSLADIRFDFSNNEILIVEDELLMNKVSIYGYGITKGDSSYLEISEKHFKDILFNNVDLFNLNYFDTTAYEIVTPKF